jgi:hypothetical protein
MMAAAAQKASRKATEDLLSHSCLHKYFVTIEKLVKVDGEYQMVR